MDRNRVRDTVPVSVTDTEHCCSPGPGQLLRSNESGLASDPVRVG